jgi:hypothetical protein
MAEWSTEELRKGHGHLPFDPAQYARHERAVSSRKLDCELVKEVLEEMVAVSYQSFLIDVRS